jgi:hypothetical protein
MESFSLGIGLGFSNSRAWAAACFAIFPGASLSNISDPIFPPINELPMEYVPLCSAKAITIRIISLLLPWTNKPSELAMERF